MEANASELANPVEDAEVRGYIKQLVADVLSVAPAEIDETELLTTYGINSVDLIDIVVKLESKYRAQFQPEAMRDLTCRALADNVIASVGANPACERPSQ
ncbi:MAG: acyl carrier protein [Sulfurifustaceae bacterium]